MKKINVLSLFDGMSCGRIALDKLGIEVNNYFAAEVDKYAIKVSAANYPEIIQLGDVQFITKHTFGQHKIDLLIGGSPCQGFSMAGKQLNFEDPRSKLFFDYVRLLKDLKPKYFLLENVKMKKTSQAIITEFLGVEPIEINSALVSAQNRKRLYWTNIPGITQPEDKGILLKDILEDGSEKIGASRGRYNEDGTISQKLEIRKDEKSNTITSVQKDNYVIRGVVKNRGELKERNEKSMCLDANYYKGADNHGQRTLLTTDGLTYRKLTPLECERLQTVPDGYTNHVSNSQRYKMLGNGWTVDVIAHILKNMEL